MFVAFFSVALASFMAAPGPRLPLGPRVQTAANPPQSGGEVSLEQLLILSRTRATKARAEAASKLQILIAALAVPYDANPNQIKKVIQEILETGELSTRPLVEVLNEPEGSAKGQNAAMALGESKASNITDELVADIGKTPSVQFRARAAWVFGRHASPAGAMALLKLLDDPDGAVVRQAALSLGRIKAKESAPRIVEKLTNAPGPLGRALLAAMADLADVKDPKVTTALVAFLESPAALEATSVLGDLLESFRKQDITKTRDLLLPSLRILTRGTPPPEDTEAMLKPIRYLVNSADREAVTILKKVMADSTAYSVKMRAALALDSAKDQSGANWLLKQPTDAIKENPENTVLLRQRAQILLELHRFRDAQRDYDDIRRISNTKKLSMNDPEFWIEYARSLAALKTFQAAADALRQAQVHGATAKDYRDFEELAELRKLPKHSSLFEVLVIEPGK